MRPLHFPDSPPALVCWLRSAARGCREFGPLVAEPHDPYTEPIDYEAIGTVKTYPFNEPPLSRSASELRFEVIRLQEAVDSSTEQALKKKLIEKQKEKKEIIKGAHRGLIFAAGRYAIPDSRWHPGGMRDGLLRALRPADEGGVGHAAEY
ncbi:hypothetical protein B0T26DRAFT_873557 [Lasiosphaeria miniovina]|uniref:Uncharacterized protein n=1 Tax=Lasiosphaeria miniovina TaxID=1954250 RepID=A0AA40ACM6_9PEZI|nr:uncharacterized protein B0T26DRAFT_873557 [Lasiosphaeria miniovina]KAK0713385.1 hypothetical protein B0T26DRAFT_873557 [Lasiosphaeria miniovina]